MEILVTLLIIVIVLAICFYLLTRYVLPAIPAPWGNFVLAIIAAIVIVFLLGKYVF